jgi:hypothetical protein
MKLLIKLHKRPSENVPEFDSILGLIGKKTCLFITSSVPGCKTTGISSGEGGRGGGGVG